MDMKKLFGGKEKESAEVENQTEALLAENKTLKEANAKLEMKVNNYEAVSSLEGRASKMGFEGDLSALVAEAMGAEFNAETTPIDQLAVVDLMISAKENQIENLKADFQASASPSVSDSANKGESDGEYTAESIGEALAYVDREFPEIAGTDKSVEKAQELFPNCWEEKIEKSDEEVA